MKKLAMKKSLIAICATILMVGCSDFLEEDPQIFSSPESLYATESGAVQGVNGIYNGFTQGSGFQRRDYYSVLGTTSDEIYYLGGNGSRLQVANYTFTPQNSRIGTTYEACTFVINRANVATNAMGDRFPELRGEALFLRAWSYFILVRMFGPVPLVTEPATVSEEEKLFPSNASIEAIYAQIILDLEEASSLLPARGETRAPGTPTSGAAKSVLSLVYLTKATSEAAEAGDYAQAASVSAEVIGSGEYALVEDYTEVFLPSNENGSEDIWSLQFTSGLPAWSSSYNADFTPNPSPAGQEGYENFDMTDLLYESFEEDDERADFVVTGEYEVRFPDGRVETDSTPHLFFTKFFDPDNVNRDDHGSNWPFMRYAEVLLVHAEAENELNGPTASALEAINAVRTRANLDPLTGVSQDQLREAIRDERWKEFYAEAIRWFDLKRWGLPYLRERVSLVRPEVEVLDRHKYFLIPQNEIDANPNLEQNDGY